MLYCVFHFLLQGDLFLKKGKIGRREGSPSWAVGELRFKSCTRLPGERLPAVFRPESNYKKTRQVLGHTVGQGLLQRIRKMGSRSDLRTRRIIDRLLWDTLRQKLTSPLEFVWASHVFPGQGLRV